MLYLKSDNSEVRLIVLESANLEELKKGRPAVSPDRSVIVCWTADLVWIADKVLDTDGDIAAILKLVDESAKRPEKTGPRPKHPPHHRRLRG